MRLHDYTKSRVTRATLHNPIFSRNISKTFLNKNLQLRMWFLRDSAKRFATIERDHVILDLYAVSQIQRSSTDMCAPHDTADLHKVGNDHESLASSVRNVCGMRNLKRGQHVKQVQRTLLLWQTCTRDTFVAKSPWLHACETSFQCFRQNAIGAHHVKCMEK